MTRRTDRIGHLIQREIGDMLLREVSDVRIGFVTVSRVEVTTDLAHAKVFVSIMGSDKNKRDSMVGLKQAAPFLRSHLAKVLKMRTVPRLQFIEDKNLDHGFRINELLGEIKAGERALARPEGDDTSDPEAASDPEAREDEGNGDEETPRSRKPGPAPLGDAGGAPG